MLSILFFAALSAFIIFKLFKVLGSREYDNDLTDATKKKFDDLRKTIVEEAVENAENVVREEVIPDSFTEADQRVIKTLKSYDGTFTIDKFLSGAKNAFEIILEAYNSHDKSVLEKLLTPQQYTKFIGEIQRLQTNGQRLNLTLVGVKGASLSELKIEEPFAYITVKFESEQITYVTDTVSEQLISGSKTRVITVTEYWTFTKILNSTSKLWELNEIRN